MLMYEKYAIKKISRRAKLLLLTVIPILIIMFISIMTMPKTIDEKSNLEATKNYVLEAESLANAIHDLEVMISKNQERM